jgi:hypothetical protein
MTTKAQSLFSLSGLVIPGLMAAVACGGTPAAASPPQIASASPAPVGTTSASPPAPASAEPSSAPAAAAASTPAPLASVVTTDPTTIQKLFDDTSHASSAALKAKGAASDDAVAKGMREFAKKVAPGMEPDGPLATGNLKEKASLQAEITLLAGKCYTIVGYSKKVKDLDLYLLLAPGILSGQDTTDDNSPVIGGAPQPMCPVSATPVTYKLGIVADQGAGEVVVQLYSKGK